MESQMIQNMPAASIPAERSKPEIRPLDRVFVWIALVLGFLTVRYAVFNPNGFFTTAASLLTFVCGTVYVYKCGQRPTIRQWFLGAVICVFSFVFSLTASKLLHVLCFIFLVAMQFWWVQAVAVKARFVTRYFLSDLFRTVVCQPLCDLSAAPRAMKAAFRGSEKASAFKNAVIGVIVTIPLTFIVAILLAGADKGVYELMRNLSRMLTDNVMSTVFQVLLAFPTGCLIFGMMRADAVQKLYPLPSDVYYHEKFSKAAIIPQSAVFAGVTPICALYIIYVISQSNYFINAFLGRLPSDMGYSEYARRGFFELCTIAVINFAVILSMLAFSKKKDGKPSAALKVYTCVMSGLTLFIISTAIAKMFMYIGEYGLTRLRLYTSWFMVLLAVIFAVLIIRAFVPKFRTSAAISAAFIVLFGALCFSRPDALIAEYNITLYEQGALEKLDAEMLCTLSDDAYVVMLDHYDTIKDITWYNYGSEHCFDDKLRQRVSDDIFANSNISSQILLRSVENMSNGA